MKDELGRGKAPDELRQTSTAAGYLGDYLRGNVPVNQLIPQHEYILDTLGLESVFEKNTTHIMLLTLEEADAVLNQLLVSVDPIATYAGNINDTYGGIKNIRKLTTYYNSSQQLIFRFKSLGIKAFIYKYKGIEYVKITGRAGTRRILKGTRYAINNPQILELGIGTAGKDAGIISGARFCIWFSMGYRAIELIFKDEYSVIDFVGDITMDIAKVIVTIFVTKILMTAGALLATLFTVTLSIAVGMIFIVAVGVIVTVSLDYIDKKYKLSEKLKELIREGMVERQKIERWNLLNCSPLINPMSLGNLYVR